MREPEKGCLVLGLDETMVSCRFFTKNIPQNSGYYENTKPDLNSSFSLGLGEGVTKPDLNSSFSLGLGEGVTTLCGRSSKSERGVITSVQARLIRQISTDSGTMEFSHQTILDPPPPCQCLCNFQGRIQDFVLGRTKFGEGPGDRLSSP